MYILTHFLQTLFTWLKMIFGRDSDNDSSSNNRDDSSLGSKVGGFVDKAFGGDNDNNNNRGNKDNSS